MDQLYKSLADQWENHKIGGTMSKAEYKLAKKYQVRDCKFVCGCCSVDVLSQTQYSRS